MWLELAPNHFQMKFVCFAFVSLYVKSEKQLLYDMLLEDLYDKIRRLEEDRHNVDITSGTSKLMSLPSE